jgi:acetyltransferase-like isoleucine patch superfamily enzyme
VRITTGARIFTHFFDAKFIPEENRPFRFYDGEVKIGNHVFIGANVVIAKPVVIGDWAVIGANSVVTRDVPPFAIMVGSPAKQVGSRNINNPN